MPDTLGERGATAKIRGPSQAKALFARVRSAIRRGLLRFRQFEAARKQRKFVGTYVAVTGSCGKSTTTMLTGALLGAFGSSAWKYDNAGMGLLRTVRKLKGPTDFVVQETSGHEPSAIEFTTKVLRVDVAVITSIGHDHGAQFRFNDIDVPDAIAREKGKLVEAVRPGGLACLNFDDPRVRAMASRTAERVVGFGRSEDADVRAANVDANWPGRLSFDLMVGGRTYPVTTRFVGMLMLTNVLGALAVVHGLGLDLVAAISKLKDIEPVHNRLSVHDGKDGKTYVLDSFKASYWSTVLLVDDLANTGITDLKFVLGDVSDIRTNSGAQYRKLIRAIGERVGEVIIAGRSAEFGRKLVGEVRNLVVAPTAIDVAKYLDSLPPCTVLIKSNKTTQLWRVLDQVTPVEGRIDA